MTFQEFIEQHENQALEIDIQELQPQVYSKYLDLKLQLENADFKKEKKKALKEVKDGITFFKKRILNFLKNDHFSTKYIGMKPPYIEHLRLYLIYKDLYSNDIEPPKGRTSTVICEAFTDMDNRGWQYAFRSESDYNLFTGLLTNFFEYKPYSLPETIIQLKRTCKTKVAKVLGEIHKELGTEGKLSTDTEYFKLVRVLNHFETEPQGDLYKALTR